MLTINCAAKCRAYPNKVQSMQIIQTLNNCRYIYNYMLDRNSKIYKRRGEHISYVVMQNLLPEMKKYLPWLKNADSKALQYACRQINTAFQKFFTGKAKYPVFHSKKGRQAYTTTNKATIHISEDHKKIKLPIVGWVKVRGLHLPDDAEINSATVSLEPNGCFYISINYKHRVEGPSLATEPPVVLGLDYKSNGLYVDSNGNCAEMPHWFYESQVKLARQQHILSRKIGSRKGEHKSYGWHKQHLKVARLQAKIAHQRTDFLHKLSRQLADTYNIIGVEDLNMRSLSNKGFGNGKATMDNAYGKFAAMLSYKLAWNGGQLVKVDRWFPSSQICNCCGTQDTSIKDLRIRKWQCKHCGTKHDRDVNAAINIKNEAIRLTQTVA